MSDGLIGRIERELGLDNAAALLASLPASDLHSLLLDVYRRRAARMSPAQVARRYHADRVFAPAASDVRGLVEFDLRALSLLPQSYSAVELSPITPQGTSSVLAGVSQDWVLTTSRNGEVVSDTTNVLALEAAFRRRTDRAATVKLMASHRLLRGQRFQPPWQQHFRVVSLAAAGRAGRFEIDALVEQLEFYIGLLEHVRIAVTPLSGRLAETVLSRLPGQVELDESRSTGRGYYRTLCFKIYGRGGTEIGDGGFVDWTQKLLSDQRERLLISGVGTERAVEHRKTTPAST